MEETNSNDTDNVTTTTAAAATSPIMMMRLNHNNNEPTSEATATTEILGGHPMNNHIGTTSTALDDSDDDDVVWYYIHWFLQHYAVLLLLGIIVILWPMGYLSFIAFQQVTDATTIHSIPSSPSGIAQSAFHQAYYYHGSSTTIDDNNNDDRDFMDPLHPPLIIVLTATTNSSSNNGTTMTHSNNDLSSSAAWSMPTMTTTTTPQKSSSSLVQNGTNAFEQGRAFALNLLPYLKQQCWSWPNAAAASSTKRSGGNCSSSYNNDDDDTFWIRVTSYYSLYDHHLQWMARQAYAVPDGSSTIIRVEYALPHNESKYHKQRILHLMNVIDTYKHQFWQKNQTTTTTNATTKEQYFTVQYTGIKYFASDLTLSTRHDLKRMDILVLPVALLLVGLVLPHANPWAIWLIPVVTMISTVSVWSILMLYVVTPYFQISTFTPTIMMSLTLGMGIDYTLFLLSRYLEEMGGCKDHGTTTTTTSRRPYAVHVMWMKSGHVLILSGLTLATTFAGLVVLPLSVLQSVGIGAATAILSSLVTNLIVVPTLLYTPVGLWIIRSGNGGCRQSDGITGLMDDLLSPLLDNPARGSGPNEHDQDDDDEVEENHDEFRLGERRHRQLEMSSPTLPRSSIWFRMSKHLLHPYQGAIILLITLQLLVPIAQQASRVKSSISFDLMLPTKSPSLKTYHYLGEQFGLGNLNPYRILFDGRAANVTMTSELGFSVMRHVVTELRSIDETILEDTENPISWTSRDLVDTPQDYFLVADVQYDPSATKRKPTYYNGIAVLQNKAVPHEIYLMAKYCNRQKGSCPWEMLRVLAVVDNVATSRDSYATYISATLGISPFSDDGVLWLKKARATIERLESTNSLSGVQIYIEGSAGMMIDTVDGVYRSFPYMIAVTTTVVFVLVGVFLKSVFQPIRSVVSIGLTLSFAFGLSVIVFQDGVYNAFTHAAASGDEFCWLVPILAFSIVVGLALDYDIFLVYRTLEYRLEGYEHKSSIALALHSTGGIITAAGVIMALAFGSLMSSSNPVLYQWSFLVTAAVLLDTFIVRTIVVPILSGLAGEYCWWPRQLPSVKICFEEFRTPHQPDDVTGLLRSLEATSEYEPLDTLRR